MGYGASGYLGLARETTWGTPVAVASGDFFYALNENVVLTLDRFATRNIVAVRSEPDDTAGARHVGGEIHAMGHPEPMRQWLRGLTNSGSVTSILSGFLHQFSYFTPTADASTLAPLPSYTLEVFRDVTSAQRYAGMQIGKATIAVQPNQDVRFTLGVMGKTTSVVAKSTATYPGSPQDPFTWDTASLQIGGAAVTNVEAFTLVIDNQIDDILALANTSEPSFFRVRGPQLVNITGTIGFDDLTQYSNFVNQTEQAFKLSFFKSQSFALVFDLPRVVYETFPTVMPGRERLTVQFTGKVRYLTSSATAYQISLTTTPKSSY